MNLQDLPGCDQLFDQVRGETDTILLSFSGGKDSVAMWLWLRGRIDIVPYYMYLVPGLESDAVIVDYYERFFGCKIHLMPHPLLYHSLNRLMYQPPQRVATIWACRLPEFDFADVDYMVAKQTIPGDNYYCAVGMRASDNLDRRYMMMQNGVLGKKRRRFYYAIWDWKIDRVLDFIQQSGCKLPSSYHSIGRTLIAMDYQYLKPFKDSFPDDYKKLLEWFPLLDAEFYRWERMYEIH